jgi:hypothetical protein
MGVMSWAASGFFGQTVRAHVCYPGFMEKSEETGNATNGLLISNAQLAGTTRSIFLPTSGTDTSGQIKPIDSPRG